MTIDTSGLIRKTSRRGTEYYVDEEGAIVSKECRGCGEVKAIGDFNKYKGSLGGREERCRACRAAYKRDWRKSKRDCQDYRVRNAERARKSYEARREEKIEYVRKWREDNPTKEAIIAGRRRARKRRLPDSITEEEWKDSLMYFNGGCALTGDRYDIHQDHVIPLSTGHGGTIFENIIPLRGDLNTSKNRSNIFDWFTKNKEHFNLDKRRFDELIEYLADINDMTTKEYEEYVRWCHDNPRTIDEIKAEEDADGASA